MLTEAVDDITNIDDYLKACEKRIKADTDRANEAMKKKVMTIRIRLYFKFRKGKIIF